MEEDKKEDKYEDFSNVRTQKNKLIPEEFPEGSFGSEINQAEPVEGKSTPWEKEQHRDSAYIYPDKEFHTGRPRQAPGAHPLHDKADSEKEER